MKRAIYYTTQQALLSTQQPKEQLSEQSRQISSLAQLVFYKESISNPSFFVQMCCCF